MKPDVNQTIGKNELMKQWRCTICGYIHTGDDPPDKCPVCGAGKENFVLVEDGSAAPSPKSALLKISEQLTRLHAHPIAVHIPNGVLPVSVAFLILAWIFNSATSATAAKLNMFFICLSMPVVIATGLIDWKNRYKGRMTKVFRRKITCAVIVALLSLILAIWWLVQPDVYSAGAGAFIFVLVHLADLLAAGIAGWYGGKLIFPKK